VKTFAITDLQTQRAASRNFSAPLGGGVVASACSSQKPQNHRLVTRDASASRMSAITGFVEGRAPSRVSRNALVIVSEFGKGRQQFGGNITGGWIAA